MKFVLKAEDVKMLKDEGLQITVEGFEKRHDLDSHVLICIDMNGSLTVWAYPKGTHPKDVRFEPTKGFCKICGALLVPEGAGILNCLSCGQQYDTKEKK